MACRTGAGALAAAAALGAAGAGQAQVSTRLTGDVSLREGYSNNPFLSSIGDTGSGFAEIALSPRVILQEALSSTILSGMYQRTQYYRRYGDSSSYDVSLTHQRQLSERLNLNLSVQYDSSITGERRSFLPDIVPETPGTPGQPTEPGQPDVPDTPGTPDLPGADGTTDPTLIGSRQRTNILNVNGSLQAQLNAFDSFTFSARASEFRYQINSASNSRSFGGTFAYDRTLSESSSVGARLSVERTYYQGLIPDSTITQPQVTYKRQLTPRINVTAALGGLFVNSTGGGPSTHSVSGNLDACRTGERSTLCITAARDATASGSGGVRTRTALGATYTYQLGAYDSLSYNLYYTQYSGRSALDPASKYVSQDLTWQERLGPRLVGGLTGSYRAYDQISVRKDYGFQVFLRVTLDQLP